MAGLVKRPGMGPGKKAPIKKVAPVEEKAPEVVIDDAVEEEKVIESVEELLEETTQEVEEVKEVESKPEEPIASVVVEEVEEEKPKKKASKKKTSKKKEKEEVAEDTTDNVVENKEEDLGPYKSKPLSESMEFMLKVTECTTPEWENRKAVITEQVESMHIDPDATPGEMRYLIADIDAALSQLKVYRSNADQQFTPLLKHIQYIANKAGTVGKNSEERKVNAIEGLIRYKANPDDTEYTNLLEVQSYAENQIKFYDEMINILQDKKAMLITFSSVVKTEAQLGGY
jgi:hypothetical protein